MPGAEQEDYSLLELQKKLDAQKAGSKEYYNIITIIEEKRKKEKRWDPVAAKIREDAAKQMIEKVVGKRSTSTRADEYRMQMLRAFSPLANTPDTEAEAA